MFAKKIISPIFSYLLILVFLLMGVLPVQAESLTGPLHANGDFVWAKGMGGTGVDEGGSIVADSSGNIYTTGVYQGTADFDPGISTTNLTSAGSSDIFITKLDSSGNFVWAKSMGGAGDDFGKGIVLDSGNVYIVGDFQGTADFDPSTGTTNLTSAGSSDNQIGQQRQFRLGKEHGWFWG